MKELVLRKLEKPVDRGGEDDIQWLCRSFGIWGGPGKNRTTTDIFQLVLERSSKGSGLTTLEITERMGLSRVSAIKHLTKLMDAGLVVRDKTEYRLRSLNLKRTVREITKDLIRTLKDMDSVIDDIDAEMGFTISNRRPASVVPGDVNEDIR